MRRVGKRVRTGESAGRKDSCEREARLEDRVRPWGGQGEKCFASIIYNMGKILHLHHNGVCLRLGLASAPRQTPYFWS